MHTHKQSSQQTPVSLTVKAIVLLVGAFAKDSGGAVVQDGGGLNGSQAACGYGGSSWGLYFRRAWVGLYNEETEEDSSDIN